MIDHDEYHSVETQPIALYFNKNQVTYFNSFGVEYTSKEIKEFFSDKDVTANIFRVQAYNSICGYFCIAFMEHILKGSNFFDCSRMFFHSNCKNNDNISLKCFKRHNA